jgi:hypothetical protein
MATHKARKSPPPAASATPDPAAVKAVTADLTARFDAQAAPSGVVGATVGAPAALLAGKGKGLKKLADALVPALINSYMIANDGKVSPEEFRQLADMGYDLILQLMAMRTKGDDTPTTTPPAPAA